MSNIKPINEYNAKGNEIYYRNSKGFEIWREFNSNSKLIHYRDSGGFESWREYDTNGNEIHYRNGNGFESWSEYDTNCNETYYRDNRGNEIWYDGQGNIIDKPQTVRQNTAMDNNTQTYVIELQDGSFYAKYEDDGETSRLDEADTFTLKEAIEKVKSLNCECKIREYIPATLGQEINPKQNILDALYLCNAEASKLNNPVLRGRIKEVIEMVKEYM